MREWRVRRYLDIWRSNQGLDMISEEILSQNSPGDSALRDFLMVEGLM